MIGTSQPEYYFIRLCIFGLHFIAPLCLLYCVFVLAMYGVKATSFRFPLFVESIAVAETLFFLLVYTPYRVYLQKEAVHPPSPSRKEREELFALCFHNIPDPEAFLNKWFLGAPAEEIKRENVKEFLLWAFFNRSGPPGEDEKELEGCVETLEKLLHRPIAPGRGKAECLRLTLDKVDLLYRSLTWYFCVGFVDFLTYMKLQLHGFHFHRSAISRFFTLFPFRPVALMTTYKSPAKHLTYWHRAHTSTTKLPLLFIHGIGIGLYPYTNFLDELNSSAGIESSDPDEQVGIIAIEIMPVSFRITHSALSRKEMCSEIEQILNEHFGPDQKFVLASHSYGTVITTHLLKAPSIAERVGPIVLIDPVSILLHLPDVAYNFTRRKPKHANEHQLYYFASMDMGVSHTLSRHFFWNENVLWKKDLAGRRVTVSLGGRDLIVNTEAVGKYLSAGSVDECPESYENGSSKGVLINLNDDSGPESTGLRMRGGEATGVEENEELLGEEEWKNRPWTGEGIDVLWHPDIDHAQVFDKPSTRRGLIHAIRTYCEEG